MTKDLKPLSAEDAAIFESRRESAAVVQHKCSGCGAWYETDKRDKPFQESFVCDCGKPITFTVPPMDGKRELSAAEILDLFDPDARLDTGMTAKEAIARAAAWWDARGRLLMNGEAARRKKAPGGAGKGVFAVSDPDDPRFLPSGIVNGHPWADLNRRSCILIVKIWHHFNVRKPDLLGGDPDRVHKMQDRNNLN